MAKQPKPHEHIGRTRLLILQPTGFCNIDCSYCYLPGRNDKHRMPLEIVESAVRLIFENSMAAPDFTVVWHAGEPLVVPPDWYRAAIIRAGLAAGPEAKVPHAIQTNGMLINDRWCDLFLEHSIRVGVSLDGPEKLHDLHRKTRTGRGTYAQVMRGIECMRKRGVPFHIICVVTNATLDAADELYEFFAQEGLDDVGFNVEEIEGVNQTSTLAHADAGSRFRRFFARFLERANTEMPPLAIREQREFLSALQHPRFGKFHGNVQNQSFGFVTVTSQGLIHTFSPELAGVDHPEFGTTAIGRLPESTFVEILANHRLRAMQLEIEAGIGMCRKSCKYFDLCLGGAPANKLAEHGTFAASDTMHCRLVNQAMTDVMLSALENALSKTAGPVEQSQSEVSVIHAYGHAV